MFSVRLIGVRERRLGKCSSQALGSNRMEWEKTSHQTCVGEISQRTLSTPHTHTPVVFVSAHTLSALGAKKKQTNNVLSINQPFLDSMSGMKLSIRYPFIIAIIKAHVVRLPFQDFPECIIWRQAKNRDREGEKITVQAHLAFVDLEELQLLWWLKFN